MSEAIYVWGRHHRAYLRACDNACILYPRELAGRCGYTNVSNFQHRRKDWREGRASGKGHVPVAYLHSIGVDLCELAAAIERDQADYAHELANLPVPTEIIVYGRAALGVAVRQPIPAGLTLSECYHAAQQTANENAAWEYKAILVWPKLQEIHFRKGSEPAFYSWLPRLHCVRDGMDFNTPPRLGSGS
jgi:hypothetical protein